MECLTCLRDMIRTDAVCSPAARAPSKCGTSASESGCCPLVKALMSSRCRSTHSMLVAKLLFNIIIINVFFLFSENMGKCKLKFSTIFSKKRPKPKLSPNMTDKFYHLLRIRL